MSDSITAIARALDDSIASVAESEYLRLRERIRYELDWRRAVGRGADDLDRLVRNQSPQYDDSVLPLLYLIRYHFSHANMAWSMLSDSLADHRAVAKMLPREATSLQVVDLGAGTGAMLFGTVLALSTMSGRHVDLQQIDFLSVDTSTPMQVLGSELWDTFLSILKDDERDDFDLLGDVRYVADQVTHTAVEVRNIDQVEGARTGPRWLTALHVLYPDQHQNRSIKRSFDQLMSAIAPSAAFMSFHPDYQELARAILPQNPMPRNRKPIAQVPDSFRLHATNQLAADIHFWRHDNPGARQAYAEWNTPRSKMEMLRWMP